MAPQTGDRICFKFQTNECVRPKCPFIHKMMTEQEQKDQNCIAKVPEKKTFPTKPMKGAPAAKKFKGKPDFEGHQWVAQQYPIDQGASYGARRWRSKSDSE